MNANVNPAIVDRVKKLMNLSTSSEPHEAARALELAQKMMAEYGLTVTEVEVGPITEVELTSIATYSKAKDWELRLYYGIADAFGGLGILFIRGRSGHTTAGPFGRKPARYLFVGPKTEAELALYAATVLQRQLVRARDAFAKSLGDMDRAGKTSYVDSYCNGWVKSAVERVAKLDPHPARRAAIQKHIESVSTGKVGLNKREHSAWAQSQGLRDGGAAELHRPMGGSAVRGLGSGS